MSIPYNILINTNNNDNYDKVIKIVNKITVMMMMMMIIIIIIMIGSALYSTYIILYPHIGGDFFVIFPTLFFPHEYPHEWRASSRHHLCRSKEGKLGGRGATRSREATWPRDVFFGTWNYVEHADLPMFQGGNQTINHH